MSEELTPAQHAIAIDAARQQLCDFVEQCTDEQWQSTPIEGDDRTVAVITDHVAHSYEYLGGWIAELLAGDAPVVTTDVVDQLNAVHAEGHGDVTRAEVLAHLKTSGDALIALVRELQPEQLMIGDGRVRAFLQVAARHPDSHRTEIETALGSS